MNCDENTEKTQDIVAIKIRIEFSEFFLVFSRILVDRKIFLRYNSECASIRA